MNGTRVSLRPYPTTAQTFYWHLGGGQSPTQATMPIAGATATITHLASNRETAATTDQEGKYTAPALPPGNYRISLAQRGFQGALRDPVALQVHQPPELDFRPE